MLWKLNTSWRFKRTHAALRSLPISVCLTTPIFSSTHLSSSSESCRNWKYAFATSRFFLRLLLKLFTLKEKGSWRWDPTKLLDRNSIFHIFWSVHNYKSHDSCMNCFTLNVNTCFSNSYELFTWSTTCQLH